jgi:hypothetical protein
VRAAVPKLKAEGAVGNRLILELGTNGPYSQAELVALLHELGPMQRIVIVNADVPRPWERQVNATIAAVAKSRSNIAVIDWSGIGPKHPADFYPDGIHLNPNGARYYAGLIVAALKAVPPPTAKPRQQVAALRPSRNMESSSDPARSA